MPKRTIRPSQVAASIRSAKTLPTILDTLPDGRVVILCDCGNTFIADNIADVLSGYVTTCPLCSQERA